MTIPEVRQHLTSITAILAEISEDLQQLSFLIAGLETELYRRKPVRKAAPRRKTPPKAVILELVASNPGLDQCGIAQALGTNPARVSEAIAGKRK